MFKVKIIFVLILCSFYCSSGISFAEDWENEPKKTSFKRLSLAECVNLAMENSPHLKFYQKGIELSKAKKAEARSGFMPKINGRVSYNYFNTNNVVNTEFSPNILDVFAENAVMSSLRKAAMVSGRNPISGGAITELDILTRMARTASSTPTATFNKLKSSANQSIIDNGLDVLRSPVHGNNLLRTEITFQQPIFLWGKVYNLNKAAKESINIARSDFKKVKNEIVYEINERYNQVLLAKDGLDLSKNTEIKFNSLLDLVESLYKGESEKVTKLDYLKLKATIGLVKNKVAEMEKSLDLAKAALKQSIGLDEKIDIDTEEDSQSIEEENYNLEDLLQKAKQNRPEFNLLNSGILAKNYDIKAANAENKPKVLIDSAFENRVDNKNYLEPDPVTFRLSVVADIPIFDGLKAKAVVNQKKCELEQLNQKRQQLDLGIELEVTEAYLSFVEAQKKYNNSKDALDSAVENRSLARQGLEVDCVETDKVIEAQVLEAKVKTEYLMSIYQYNLVKAKINKVTGNADFYQSKIPLEETQIHIPEYDGTSPLFMMEKADAIL